MNVDRRLRSASAFTAMAMVLTTTQCVRQPAASAESDSARVVRLDREVRALVKTEGCSSSGECRAAPVGDRPCGGPRDYVVYCARTTDTAALRTKLDELIAAERAYNRKSGMASTCEFRMPPQTALVGGSCRAVPAR